MTPDPQKQTFSRLAPEKTGSFRKNPEPQPRRGPRAIEIILFSVFAILLIVAGIALYTIYSPRHREVPNTVDQGIEQDRLNFLFLGVSGDRDVGGGKDLADSIIFVSLKPSTRQAAIVSVPRDLYGPVGSYGKHRLNMAHSIGAQSGYPGGGPGLIIDTVEGIFGQPIHAFVRLDFNAFETIIDDLGGIDIDVQRPFYDFLFKDGFQKGRQHMNGDRALRYARYRYIEGPEGDNYARELRQQQVITAVREKLQNRSAGDVLRLVQTVRTLSKYTDTNLTTAQMVWLYNKFGDTDPGKIRHVSLKPFMEKFHLRTLADPGEAVRPLNNDLGPVRQIVSTIFSDMRQIGTPDDIRFSSTPPSHPPAPPTPTTSASASAAAARP